MPTKLQGKVAVITGGTEGMGLAGKTFRQRGWESNREINSSKIRSSSRASIDVCIIG
jgi:hypothetical protein